MKPPPHPDEQLRIVAEQRDQARLEAENDLLFTILFIPLQSAEPVVVEYDVQAFMQHYSDAVTGAR
ncbi:hypothetical protein C0160_09350 [Moraxella catarrhalis]|nr:hypothetical protein [Moraxella catarrhalis]|eukprot:30490-Eustigmatos_ZCMA.PRE.1